MGTTGEEAGGTSRVDRKTCDMDVEASVSVRAETVIVGFALVEVVDGDIPRKTRRGEERAKHRQGARRNGGKKGLSYRG